MSQIAFLDTFFTSVVETIETRVKQEKNIPYLYQPSSLTREVHTAYDQTAYFTMLIRNRNKLYGEKNI